MAAAAGAATKENRFRVTARELAEILGVTTARITQLKQASVAIPIGRSHYDLRESCRNYIGTLKTNATSKAAAEARLAKLKAEARIAATKADEAEGRTVPVADVHELMIRLGSEMRSRLLEWRASLPHQLEGRDAQAIHQILGARVIELLEDIHSAAGKFDT